MSISAHPAPPPAPPQSLQPAVFDPLSPLFSKLAGQYVAAAGKAGHFGITAAMLADYNAIGKATKDELAELTEEKAKEILYDRVWRPLNGDKLPPAVAVELFPVAIGRGVERAGKLLQKVVAAATDQNLKIDGRIGPVTLDSLKDEADVLTVVGRLLSHKDTLVWRIGDGRLFGHKVDPIRVALLMGRLALTKGL